MSTTIQSMTGFGNAEATIGSLRLAVEVRSVNHRFFTPSIKLPPALTRMETEMRELLRKHVTRGHVSLSLRVEREAQVGPRIDVDRLLAYAAQLRAIPADAGLDAHIDLASLLRLPDVVTTSYDDDDSVAALPPAEVLALVTSAIAGFVRMRSAEGGRLAEYLLERLAIIELALSRLAERAPQRLLEQRDRLTAAVQELAAGIAVDPQRLAQEIAILADRVDVAEELSRFASHNEACRQALAAPGADGVGKRLGFILQEMVREANTTGSKANDAAMQRDVVLIKEELERMREQVENLE
ncbi:MAG TPA: YicC/YloC family endoribonuclease [Gemmatimonadaceae bacterium]|nr:YicC/YloC family endoribonuclease [Gemmatimonadaceae bacterium]